MHLVLAGREGKNVKTTKIYKIRKTNEAKLKINLTSIQKDVVIGTLLGDSSIERAKPNHNSRIRFDQSFPEHATYLIYLFGPAAAQSGPWACCFYPLVAYAGG